MYWLVSLSSLTRYPARLYPLWQMHPIVLLVQCYNSKWMKPISYFSRKLKSTETRYSMFDKELLAVYLSIKHFQYYVEGCKFYIMTDYKPITYSLFCNPTRYSPRQARQLEFISQLKSDIRHVHGRDNPVADALFRIDIRTIHRQSITKPSHGNNKTIRTSKGC